MHNKQTSRAFNSNLKKRKKKKEKKNVSIGITVQSFFKSNGIHSLSPAAFVPSTTLACLWQTWPVCFQLLPNNGFVRTETATPLDTESTMDRKEMFQRLPVIMNRNVIFKRYRHFKKSNLINFMYICTMDLWHSANRTQAPKLLTGRGFVFLWQSGTSCYTQFKHFWNLGFISHPNTDFCVV